MRLGSAPHCARVTICGRGALARVLSPASAPPWGIGSEVSTGGPPNAVPSVFRNTTRGLETVRPAGRRIERRMQRPVSVHRGSVARTCGWNSGDPGSGPPPHIASTSRAPRVNRPAALRAVRTNADTEAVVGPSWRHDTPTSVKTMGAQTRRVAVVTVRAGRTPPSWVTRTDPAGRPDTITPRGSGTDLITVGGMAEAAARAEPAGSHSKT